MMLLRIYKATKEGEIKIYAKDHQDEDGTYLPLAASIAAEVFLRMLLINRQNIEEKIRNLLPTELITMSLVGHSVKVVDIMEIENVR